VPKTRTDFWRSKFVRNKERDRRLLAAAHSAGWDGLVLWECELKDTDELKRRLTDYLGPARSIPRSFEATFSVGFDERAATPQSYRLAIVNVGL
jgi:hypothetical protein